MKSYLTQIGSATLLACLAGVAVGAEGISVNANSEERVPEAIAHPELLGQHEIATRLLSVMPKEHRNAIIAAGGFGSEYSQHNCSDAEHNCSEVKAPEGMSPREFADSIISDELSERMTPVQRQLVEGVVAALERNEQPPALCFAPGTDPEYAFMINQLIEFPLQIAFQQTGRWSSTAASGGGLSQGTPTVITYSYVPDGTTVPNLIGFSGNSNLQAWLNGIYGSPANWQPIFDQVFDRWAELIGTTYQFEPNDDGVTLNGAGGVLGVRGDVRIAAIALDGNSGTLAYNNFPNDGDMVFDSADSFYNNTGANSLRLRNIIAHEHGHGLGMLHVCPAVGTKLMEPFISTAYDGPQLDDVLNGQRHYGDNFEPQSDDPTNAPNIGTLGINDVASVTNVSIDDNSDIDFYEITLTQPAQVIFALAPDAASYLQGTQTQQCNTGTNTNYNAIHDLRIDVYPENNPGVPLASADNTGVGGSEDLIFNATSAGSYLIGIFGGNTNSIQRYSLSIGTIDLPFLEPEIIATPPASVDPGQTTTFNVTINPRDDSINGTPQLLFRANGGSFSASDLNFIGGSTYTATLPASACGDNPEFFVSAVGQVGGTITLPSGGSSAPFSALVGEISVEFADNFQSNQGWGVTGDANGAAEGEWQRAVPGGDGSRGDAPDDFDGSGFAYVTGNGGAGSNTDVDGGQTILTSPAIDLSMSPDAVVSYARWYDNTGSGTGAAPGADIFTVQISDNNGGSWTNLEVVGPNTAQSSGGWFQASFTVGDFVSTSSQVRIRFIAEDIGDGSVIEAAVDAVEFSGLICEDVGGCSAADIAEPLGTLNFFDISAFIALYNAGDSAADLASPFGTLNFFDISTFINVYNVGCP
ncbi:MAG: GC-type dockerin domain-anchored protein [Phycisphaerales bacterium]